MDPLKIEIVVRQLRGSDPMDQVVAIRAGGHLFELPEDSTVEVEHGTGPGGIGGRVRVELLASQVRYVDEAEARAE